MADLVKIKGLKGKQNKKKWNKNIDVSGLLEKMEQQHTQKIRQKFQPALVVESQSDKIRKPLDPDRFKSRGTPLPKTKYDNKIKKQSLLDDSIQDVWASQKQVNSKYKAPEIPAIIKPSTGHSYNPTQKSLNKVVQTIIDYEAQRQKKTKQIKKPVFKQQQIRHRNKKVRAQQLQLRQRKAARQFLHQIHSHKKLTKLMEEKQKKIEQKIKLQAQKEKKWEEEARQGKVRYGRKLGKIQYKWRQDLPQVDEIGKKLSHIGGNESLIKDRFDSVFRRGIFEPRIVKVHANKTKKIKSSTKYRDDGVQQKKEEVAFIQ